MQLKMVLLIVSMVFAVSFQAAADWKQELKDADIASNYARVRELSVEHNKEIFEGDDIDLKFISATTLLEEEEHEKSAREALKDILKETNDEEQIAVIHDLLYPAEDDEG